MNTYDTAIDNLCATRSALLDDIVKRQRELTKVDRALRALGVDPDTRRGPRTTKGMPKKEEQARRRDVVRAFAEAQKEPFTAADLVRLTEEPMTLLQSYQQLTMSMSNEGELALIEKGAGKRPSKFFKKPQLKENVGA